MCVECNCVNIDVTIEMYGCIEESGMFVKRDMVLYVKYGTMWRQRFFEQDFYSR